jgi:excinuclease ABC subunit C
MKQFGSLKRLRAATVEELMTVPGIGRRTAEAVLAAVAQPEVGEATEVQPVQSRPADDADVRAEETVETTTAPAGPAERGTPHSGSGATAEVGLVAS